MNKVELYGRLTKDPETRWATTKNGEQLAISRTTVAVNRKFKTESGPDADFFEIQAFGKIGEVLGKYFFKGNRIAITGRIETDNWQDDQGQKHFRTVIRVEDLDIVETKAETGGGAQQQQSQQQNQRTTQQSQQRNQRQQQVPDDWMNIPDGIEGMLPF